MGRAALLVGALALLAMPALARDETDPATETETVHVVLPGETLGGIAQRAKVPRVLIIEANGLKEPYPLRAGQKLVIPRRSSYTVKDGDTGFGVALDLGVPWSAIATASGIDPKAPIKPGQVLTIPTQSAPALVAASPAPRPPVAAAPASPSAPIVLTDKPPAALAWPLAGKVRRTFAARGEAGEAHDGIDILADRGTAARSSAAGTVIFAGDGPKEYGLTVIVHHGDRWTTTYSFLDKVTVKEGDPVRAGERVGLVGQTGIATQPQLHYEVRRNRVALDPVKWLPKAQPSK